MFAIILSAALAASPADEVRTAAADIETLPLELRPGTRYLSLYALPPDARRETLQVASYTLNVLSRARAISQPVQISSTLVRFHISQFAPRNDEFAAWKSAWEKLAEDDPYFHLRAEVLATTGERKDRHVGATAGSSSSESGVQLQAAKNLRSNPSLHVQSQKISDSPGHSTAGPASSGTQPSASLRTSNSALRTVTVDGGWTDLAAAARLRASSQSIGAILRADYFIAAATRTPAYYDFTGVPATENEFLKSLGVDRDVIDRLRANAGANLIISGVTNKPRRVVWSQGPLGGVYATLDVETVDATRDPIRRPISADGFQLKFDVSEWFAVAPNGLWRTALFDAAGRRQNTVPDRVAKDTSDPLSDGIVVPLVSCIRCHRESGLRPFADDQTKLLAGRVDLLSTDPNIVQRAAEFYDEPRLQRQMQFDRETYAAAVARATAMGATAGSSSSECGFQLQAAKDSASNPSLYVHFQEVEDSSGARTAGPASSGTRFTPEQLADALAGVVRSFAYQPINIAQAAREVGIDAAAFRTLLAATHDPVILLLLENRAVLRSQWESSFAEAATTATTLTVEMYRRGESKSRAEARSSLSNRREESITNNSLSNSSANSAPLREQK